jgi:hypothetical protein
MSSRFERRCQDLFERSAAIRSETERVGRRFEALRQSSSALRSDMDRVLAQARAEVRRGAAVRHAGSQLATQCVDNLESVSSLLRVQREIEEDIHRRRVERAMTGIIDVFAAAGMLAFRWDANSDPPVIFQQRNTGRAAARVQ